tara:strand:+ start:4820 stop:5749 length:930 start_codon:yes stop_codon:yes gene_type:complete
MPKIEKNFFKRKIISRNEIPIEIKGHKIIIKREDEIDKWISGNKFRKLKYIFLGLNKKKINKLLSFGGAYSNHLAALAKAGNLYNVKTIGIIRGKEWETKYLLNPTLSFCKKNNMYLYFVSREEYRLYEQGITSKKIINSNSDIKIIGEGGKCTEAIKGCQEILTPYDKDFDTVCVSVGTGFTLSGVIESSYSNQFVLGFLSLKHKKMKKEILKNTSRINWRLIDDYIFKGYAKVNEELINFINDFYKEYKIPLDPIYNSKMVFGIFDMIKKNKWNWGKNILVINSGGLQGVNGMNLKLKERGCKIINF